MRWHIITDYETPTECISAFVDAPTAKDALVAYRDIELREVGFFGHVESVCDDGCTAGLHLIETDVPVLARIPAESCTPGLDTFNCAGNPMFTVAVPFDSRPEIDLEVGYWASSGQLAAAS